MNNNLILTWNEQQKKFGNEQQKKIGFNLNVLDIDGGMNNLANLGTNLGNRD